MFEQKIKSLEESFKLVENKIRQLEKSDNVDRDEITKLIATKNRYLLELRDLRKQQYEYSQTVDFGDDR